MNPPPTDPGTPHAQPSEPQGRWDLASGRDEHPEPLRGGPREISPLLAILTIIALLAVATAIALLLLTT